MDDPRYILRCPFDEPAIPDLDVYRFVIKQWTERGDNIALIDASDERQLTYTEFHDVIARVSCDMTSAGVVQRDVITIWSGNCVELLVVALAAWRLGARVALVGSSLTAEEARRQLLKVNTDFLLYDSQHTDRALQALKDLPRKTLFRLPSGHEFASIQSKPRPPSPASSSDRPIVIHRDDTALFMFSSGTTGHPKAVELSHHNVVVALETSSSRSVGREMPPHILFLPLSHFYGLFSALRSMDDCATIILMARFAIEEYLRLIAKHQILVLFLVPAVAVMIVKNPDLVKKYDLSSVLAFYSSSAPLAPEVIAQLKELMPGTIMPMRVAQAYGMTEATGAITRQPGQEYAHECPVASVGIVVPHAQLKVMDEETSRAVAPYVRGEIAVRGDIVMKGYYGDPQATRSIIDPEGWLHTGDIGYYDDVGFVFVVDRAKELIKHKGMQVAPAELEDILLSHPGVQDAAVVGLPDELSGELPLAFVVPAPGGAKVTEAEVKEFVSGRVAPYKQLTGGVRFVSSIPRNATGKILRRVLRDSVMKAKV